MPTKSTVLIVDDDVTIRRVLGALLSGDGHQLFYAANGQEALELAAQHKPDVVLLDIMMPVMDGFEVCRRLRGEHGLSEVPILMVTALSDRTSRLEGINAGADDFISKPFDRELLLARVRTITRLNRYRKLHEQSAELAQVSARLEQEVAERRRLEARLHEYETRYGARV